MDDATPLTRAIHLLLTEGTTGETGGHFLDRDGLLATVAPLDAAQASTPGAPGGTTIAGQVEHVRWFLSILNAFVRGERPDVDWSQSWSVDTVDAAAWAQLQADLRREAQALLDHVEDGVDPENETRLTTLISTVAHVAYHVGAVRQMIKVVTAD